MSRETQTPRATPAANTPPASCRLAVKATPNAPRNALAGWAGGALKVKIHAPALEGRANDELCAFLADALALPRRAVTVEHGGKSRQKIVRIDGMPLDTARKKLGV